MTVTVPISLTLEEQAALQAQAEALGITVDSLLRGAVQHIIAAAPEHKPPRLSAGQWERELDEWLDSLPDFPALSDESISRERIYTREDEWR